ncbi:cysteine--tRNA ligase, partial [Candidatus Parcubacteria bacterium]|nr:cysteine--tRNA ligase [Candidatus Parcubacteria bacterium]
EYINDDLNTPKVLAYLWDLVNEENISKNIIEKFDSILGLKLLEQDIIPEEILKLKEERDLARTNKDFAKSDELRDKIKDLGYQVLDSTDTSEVVKM